MSIAEVGIIGAGPAGLAAAYELGKQGIRAEVFEAGPAVGGMARTFELWGQKVDLGPHRFFSSDARINRLWLEVLGDDYRMVSRQTRIFYNGRFFEYPLQVGNALSGLGPLTAARCVASYARQKLRPAEEVRNFEQWVQGRFGRRLYEIFFKAYSEKLWGIPCTQLDADFASQRIRKLSFFEAVRNALLQGRGNRHATLVDRFAYPLEGCGQVYSKMARAVVKQGGRVHLETPVRGVRPRSDGGLDVELVNGERRHYDKVVSTMPLTHLVKALPEVPPEVVEAADRLKFRNTILVYLQVEAQKLFPDQWVYVHSPNLAVGRITNFRNWVPELNGTSDETILALELWCDPGDERWIADDAEHIARAEAELRKTGLVGEAEITAGHVERVPNCYPVYEVGYRENVSVLRKHLQSIPGLDVIGRYGSFKYNNQDHSLLMGILAAENIALDHRHDLREVNADDSYQEAAIIDETGLVPQTVT